MGALLWRPMHGASSSTWLSRYSIAYQLQDHPTASPQCKLCYAAGLQDKTAAEMWCYTNVSREHSCLPANTTCLSAVVFAVPLATTLLASCHALTSLGKCMMFGNRAKRYAPTLCCGCPCRSSLPLPCLLPMELMMWPMLWDPSPPSMASTTMAPSHPSPRWSHGCLRALVQQVRADSGTSDV